MSTDRLIDVLTYVEPAACIVALLLIVFRRQVRNFKFLAAYLFVRGLSTLMLIPLVYLTNVNVKVIERHLGYRIYFSVYWTSYAIEALLGFGIIFSLYKLAMAPLPGLQRLGTIMFRWAGAIGFALALSAAISPHFNGTSFIIMFVTQLEKFQSVLTLCMLTFVTLASKPMGLSHRNKIFGVSLGLGVLATADLIASNFLPNAGLNMSSLLNVLNGSAICAALTIWSIYFALPEPKRRMIVLPTTSPFLRWNQISQVLGDEPGYVVLSEMTPDMFAPAEVEIMRRAAMKMTEQHMATG